MSAPVSCSGCFEWEKCWCQPIWSEELWERGEHPNYEPGWPGLAGSKVCVCLHFCVKPAQTKSMFMEQRFWTTLEYWMKADGHRFPLSPLRVNFKAWMNIANENWSLLCPLIMVMWCNPSDQSLMSHCGPYWCSDWRSRESPGLLWISVWSLLSILWPAYLTRCHSMSAPRVLHMRCAPMYIPAPNFLSNASFLSC